jgi:Nuclear pore component
VVSLTQRDDDNTALPLEDVQLVDRPGLQLLQASWHPSSDVHFAVLASDNVFRLYHIDDLSSPVSRRMP